MSLPTLHRALDPQESATLAEALGDTPLTVGSTHLLRRGLCKAWAIGGVALPRAAIVQSDFLPAEPVGFGSDADLLWELLAHVNGWECVLVDSSCVPRLSDLIRRQTGGEARIVQDINFQLNSPVRRFTDPSVRLLGPRDAALLWAAPREVAGTGYRNTDEFLREGVVAGAVVEGAIVAIAYTPARSATYADIGVHTLERFRRRGFGRAAASLVAERLQAEGQIPVWSAGDSNTASLSLARTLGFVEASQRSYVVKAPGSNALQRPLGGFGKSTGPLSEHS